MSVYDPLRRDRRQRLSELRTALGAPIPVAALDFIDRHELIHFIGQSGTGKSHLAIALGVEAARAGRSVYFTPLADIIDSLARAEREGPAARAHFQSWQDAPR